MAQEGFPRIKAEQDAGDYSLHNHQQKKQNAREAHHCCLISNAARTAEADDELNTQSSVHPLSTVNRRRPNRARREMTTFLNFSHMKLLINSKN